MDFYDVIETRHSFRSYLSDPVPDDAILRISGAVQLAPTACNRQPFQLLLVKDPVQKERICNATIWGWMKEAPMVAVITGDDSAAWKRPEGDSILNVDVGIVMEHFVLAAAAEGLGTCWICHYDRAAMDRVLGLSKPWQSVAISPLGFAKPGSCRDRNVKPLNELVRVIG